MCIAINETKTVKWIGETVKWIRETDSRAVKVEWEQEIEREIYKKGKAGNI